MPLGRDSMSDNIEAPVVEKPEHDSKKASAKPVMLSVTINGMAPRTAEMNQHRVTIRKPSLTLSCFVSLWHSSISAMPVSPDASMVIRNGIYTDESSYINDTITDGSMENPTTIRTIPIILKIELMLKFMIPPVTA